MIVLTPFKSLNETENSMFTNLSGLATNCLTGAIILFMGAATSALGQVSDQTSQQQKVVSAEQTGEAFIEQVHDVIRRGDSIERSLLSFITKNSEVQTSGDKLLFPVRVQFDGREAEISQEGDENRALIEQLGMNQQAGVIQNGRDNLAALIQYGEGNRGLILQYGHGNRSDILQDGFSNEAVLSITGNMNQVHVQQLGTGNLFDVDLNGDFNFLDLVQEGNFNVYERLETGDSVLNEVIMQSGNNNVTTQTGMLSGGRSANVIQEGNGLELTIRHSR